MVIPATFCGQKSYVFFTRLWHDCLFHSWFSACMYVCLSLSSSLIFFHGNTYIPAMINPYCIVLAKNLLDCYGKATAKKSSIELAKTWWIAATEEDLFSSSFFFFQVRTLLKAAPEFHICCALCAAIWMWTSPRRESLTADAIRLDPIWKISISEHFHLTDIKYLQLH